MARALAFGTLDPALWGVAWLAGDGDAAQLAVGAARSSGVVSGGLEVAQAEWSFAGEGASLLLTPAGPPSSGPAAHDPVRSADSLTTVTGHFVLDGVSHEVSCPGWRATIHTDLDLHEFDSFRQVAGWVGSDDGVALLSLRARKARGQEGDVVSAAVLEAAPIPAVIDPRLSTTYAADGTPRRTSLELWFDEPPADDGDGAAPPYPRRAAGEATGSTIDWNVSGFALHAELLRWHTRGQEGAGVYLLGRRQ